MKSQTVATTSLESSYAYPVGHMVRGADLRSIDNRPSDMVALSLPTLVMVNKTAT